MGLGILEPRDGHHVPGTVMLDQSASNPDQPAAAGELRRGTGKNSHIVLVPQPSNDPDDPLNWPTAKKWLFMTAVLGGTACIYVLPVPILNAGIVPIALDLGRSVSDIARLGGYFVLAVGAVAPIASGFARKYGKRPVFIASSIIGLVGCLVAEFSPNYNTLVGGRVLQGVGGSAYESLSMAVVGDVLFLHQRGPTVAIIIFLLSGLSNGVSIVAGLITVELGWKYTFHILLPFVALQTVMIVFLAPESSYNRSSAYNIDRLGSDYDVNKSAAEDPKTAHVETTAEGLENGQGASSGDAAMSTSREKKPKSYWRQLALCSGTYTDKSLLKMTLACFAIFSNAIAAYNILVSSLVLAWFVGISVLAGVIFAGPPWNYDAASIGYVSVGPLIGGILATAFMGLVSDWSIKYLTRRNNGVYEPEFRIPLIAVGAVACAAGLAGFGRAVEAQISIYALATLWGLTLFGMSIIGTTTMAYALDAAPAHVVEIFIMNIVFKNFFYYGVTNYIVDWYVAVGAAKLFYTTAGMSVAFVLFSWPMYVYGKRYRQYWSRNNLLVRTGLDDGL
ncbi:hypothetical protein ACJZ2D_008618 [Fusarium nematophilum]